MGDSNTPSVAAVHKDTAAATAGIMKERSVNSPCAWRNPPSKQQKLSKKCVQFVPDVRIHRIKHYSQISKSQRNRIWYQKEEMDAIKLELEETLFRLETGLPVDDQEITLRGLEWKIKRLSQQTKQARLKAVQAVILEQELQREENCVDYEVIAHVYSDQSSRTQVAAQEAALRDEHYVQELEEQEFLVMQCQRQSGFISFMSEIIIS